MTGLTGELTLTRLYITVTLCVLIMSVCVHLYVRAGTGTVAERGGGTTTVVTESGSLHRDTLARSTNA